MVSLKTKHASEHGFIFVLLTLSLTVLLGTVAYVLDNGRLMLEQQRVRTALDLAALGGTSMLHEGYTESDARTYGAYTSVAGLVASRPETDEVDWSEELAKVGTTRLRDDELDGLAVDFAEERFLTFGSVLRLGAVTVDQRGAASFSGAERSVSMHIVMALDSSVNSEMPYGVGCEQYGAGELPCNSARTRDAYCVPGCSNKLDVLKNFASQLIESLNVTDTVTIIDTAAAAQVVVEEASGLTTMKKRSLIAQIEALGVERYTDGNGEQVARGYERIIDPAATSSLVAEVAGRARIPQDRTIFLNLSTGIPIHGMKLGSFAGFKRLVNGTAPAITGGPAPSGSTTILDYENTLIPYVQDKVLNGECSNSFAACALYYNHHFSQTMSGNGFEPGDQNSNGGTTNGSGSDDSQQIDPLLVECEQNPTTFNEYLAAAAVSQLSTKLGVSTYTVTAGVNESRQFLWIDASDLSVGLYTADGGAYASIWRDMNFERALAHDLSQVRVAVNNDIGCVGERDPATTGLHIDLQPSGYSTYNAVQRFLSHAGRSLTGGRGGASRVPHLISN